MGPPRQAAMARSVTAPARAGPREPFLSRATASSSSQAGFHGPPRSSAPTAMTRYPAARRRSRLAASSARRLCARVAW